MLDRPRQTPLIAAVVCLLLFAALAVGVSLEWSWLMEIDDTGRDLEGWADDQGLRDTLRVVEVMFGTATMALITLVLAGVMYGKHHRRAGTLILAVMTLTLALTHGTKWLVDRDRPLWQNTQWSLDNGSFPSGHASMAGPAQPR